MKETNQPQTENNEHWRGNLHVPCFTPSYEPGPWDTRTIPLAAEILLRRNPGGRCHRMRIAGGRQVQLGLVHLDTEVLECTAPRRRRHSTARAVDGHVLAWKTSTKDAGSVTQASYAPPRFILLLVLVGGTGRCCIV